MVKIAQTREELEKHLDDQINFLELSSKSYDSGSKAEAKRIAVVIRVLVHDTSNSKSLLSQLNLKNIKFLDTSYNIEDPQILTKHGLVMVDITGVFTPRCAVPPKPWEEPHEFKTFDIWWNKIVIIDNEGNKFSRKDLILSLANKDGGAHVDPKLDEPYAKLTRHNSMGLRYSINKGPEIPVKSIEGASVRQIAHEVLKSI